VAAPTGVCSCRRRRGAAEADPDDPWWITRDLWRAARAGRAPARRGEATGATHCPADAPSRVDWRQPPARHDRCHTAGQGGQTGARLGRPRFHCFPAELALGCRHHLRADGERFFSISQWFWMPGAARSSAGRWPTFCGPNWCWTRWRWRSASGRRASSIIATKSPPSDARPSPARAGPPGNSPVGPPSPAGARFRAAPASHLPTTAGPRQTEQLRPCLELVTDPEKTA
jgi:hypothetical protein